jgi:hypothetical protein
MRGSLFYGPPSCLSSLFLVRFHGSLLLMSKPHTVHDPVDGFILFSYGYVCEMIIY